MEKIIGTVPGKCRKKREKARLTLNNNPEISWHMKKSRRTYNGVHLNKKSNTQDVVEQSLTTQDESYYILDAKEGATVYLGLKDNIKPEEMLDELEKSQRTGEFEVEKYVGIYPAKKHDHFLIPAGTVHCSGRNSMVLEISATPYIFTFKLWDWGRMGLDGRPRPINIAHGANVIQWNRTESWVKEELINKVSVIGEGDSWREEKTGLHEWEFIETRRHWFTDKVLHKNESGVNVLNLIEGRSVIVESPIGQFSPFVVHYAETFIIPAAIKEYTIKPYGESEGMECGTIKAFVRHHA